MWFTVLMNYAFIFNYLSRLIYSKLSKITFNPFILYHLYHTKKMDLHHIRKTGFYNIEKTRLLLYNKSPIRDKASITQGKCGRSWCWYSKSQTWLRLTSCLSYYFSMVSLIVFFCGAFFCFTTTRFGKALIYK